VNRWYVVHSQPHAEARAVQHLRNQGFEVYFPRYRRRRRHARRVETVLAPLFPRYIFVSMDIEACQWRSINSTIGVHYLICDGEIPVPVPHGVIEDIRCREGDDGVVMVAPTALRRGQMVRIVDGPFADLGGLFEEMVDEERVMLLLDILGRKVQVRIPIESVAVSH
jgi:transcriptional antiterminator RfaH